MARIRKKYDISQCALYKCQSKKRLEALLQLEGIRAHQVCSLVGYHSFEIAKKHSDDMRTITAPDKDLKRIQRRILDLLQPVIRPEWLISGEKDKSYISNGETHLDSRYVLTMDIRKFYDNCTREPVYQFFRETLHDSPDVAKILTDIVTYDSGIPTGCPTSQMIAFYAYYDMFVEIHAAAAKYGCKFTLYVDDMTFSSLEPFSPSLLTREVDRILRKYGHKLKNSKVKYYGPSDYKLITGTVVTPCQTLAVPNRLQKEIYDAFLELKPAMDKSVCTNIEAKRITSLKGQIEAARRIDGGKFPEIERLVDSIKVPDPTHPQR